MSLSIKGAGQVPPAEIERRIAEYCRISFERGLPVQVVYQDPHAACPWEGCGYRIDGIQFHVEAWPDLDRRLRESWWQGPGLVGRCPKCGQHVQFSVTAKLAVHDLTDLTTAILPDDWQEKAYLVSKPGRQPSRNGA